MTEHIAFRLKRKLVNLQRVCAHDRSLILAKDKEIMGQRDQIEHLCDQIDEMHEMIDSLQAEIAALETGISMAKK